MTGTWRAVPQLVTVLLTVLGVVLIGVALRDVIHELFHPEEHGSISRTVSNTVWRAVRTIAHQRRSVLRHAGTAILVAVALTWTALVTLGWALVYAPRLPYAFHVSDGVPPNEAHGLATALYISLAALTSLGTPDLSPSTPFMRGAAATETFVGLVLITAWITWVLSIHPVLAERRAFSSHVMLARRAMSSARETVRELPPVPLAELLRSFTERLLRIDAEVGQTRVAYYFQNQSEEAALPKQLSWLLDLSREAEKSESLDVAHHGRMLHLAIDHLLDALGREFLQLEDARPEDVLQALADDHLLDLNGKTRDRAQSDEASAGSAAAPFPSHAPPRSRSHAPR